ncbi:hypothetical protein HZA57_03140 [Candidatus Poribacteria bacterium]|nr:hypothetical protein [Candidatus Poribacteria bacterium]
MTEQAANSIRKPGSTAWIGRTAALVGLAVVLSAAILFHPERGWNVNSRLALVLAVVDGGTFCIDSFHSEPALQTGDKARFEGHYYSDKVFGVSLLGVPAYKLMTLVWPLFGREITIDGADYVVRMVAVSVPAGVSAALLWLLCIRLGAAPRRALFAVAAMVFGTAFFGYSTLLLPYAPAVACCLGALYLVFHPGAKRVTAANSFTVGLLCGYALLCDFLFGLMVAGLGVVYLMRLADQTGLWGMRAFADMKGTRTPLRRAPLYMLAAALGGGLPLGLFAAYSWSIFGELTIPYRYEALSIFRSGMERGFMGATWPRLGPLWFLTLHPYRGIFFWSPVAAAALAGLVLGARSTGRRRIAGWLGLWAFGAYLLFNASYFMWWGGWSMGPRHLLPMMAAVPLGLAEVCRRDRHRAWFVSVVLLGTVSMALNMALAVQDPQIPQGNETQVLLSAKTGTELAVPQFVYLRNFVNVAFGRADAAGMVHPFPVRWLLAIVLPLAVLAIAAVFCPARHTPFERLEVPFNTEDGSAAPPPQPIGMASTAEGGV